MMRSSRVAVFAALMLSASAAFAAPPLKSLHMKLKFNPPSKSGAPSVAEFWVSNGKSRIFMQNHVLINDGKNMMSYTVKDPSKQYMVVPTMPALQGLTTEQIVQKYNQNPIMKNAKKKGQTKMLGHSTTIYEVPKSAEGGPATIWMTNDTGIPIPLKMEQSSPAGKSVQEVTLLELNKAVSDALFKAPAGYKKVVIPSQPPLPQAAPKGSKPSKK
jgi:hypothetical protein